MQTGPEVAQKCQNHRGLWQRQVYIMAAHCWKEKNNKNEETDVKVNAACNLSNIHIRDEREAVPSLSRWWCHKTAPLGAT